MALIAALLSNITKDNDIRVIEPIRTLIIYQTRAFRVQDTFFIRAVGYVCLSQQ